VFEKAEFIWQVVVLEDAIFNLDLAIQLKEMPYIADYNIKFKQILIDCVQALFYLHSAGYVHNNISKYNIFYSKTIKA